MCYYFGEKQQINNDLGKKRGTPENWQLVSRQNGLVVPKCSSQSPCRNSMFHFRAPWDRSVNLHRLGEVGWQPLCHAIRRHAGMNAHNTAAFEGFRLWSCWSQLRKPNWRQYATVARLRDDLKISEDIWSTWRMSKNTKPLTFQLKMPIVS